MGQRLLYLGSNKISLYLQLNYTEWLKHWFFFKIENKRHWNDWRLLLKRFVSDYFKGICKTVQSSHFHKSFWWLQHLAVFASHFLALNIFLSWGKSTGVYVVLTLGFYIRYKLVQYVLNVEQICAQNFLILFFSFSFLIMSLKHSFVPKTDAWTSLQN